MKMTKPSYPGLFHYIHKAMADVEYPITRDALLELIADRQVMVDWETQAPVRSFIEPIRCDEFTCAADLYCKMIAFL